MRKSLLALGAAMMIFGTTPVVSQAQSVGSLMHNPNAIEWDFRGNSKKISLVESNTPSGMAINANVKKRKTNPWDIVLFFELRDGVEKGDKISVEFMTRTAKAPKGQDNAEFVVFVGRNEAPYDYIISEDVLPGSEWETIKLEAVAEADMPAGDVKVEFQLAKHKQVIEFESVYVRNHGPALAVATE